MWTCMSFYPSTRASRHTWITWCLRQIKMYQSLHSIAAIVLSFNPCKIVMQCTHIIIACQVAIHSMAVFTPFLLSAPTPITLCVMNVVSHVHKVRTAVVIILIITVITTVGIVSKVSLTTTTTTTTRRVAVTFTWSVAVMTWTLLKKM